MCVYEPTEILAKQHYDLSKKVLQVKDLKIEFLTGKTEYKKRKEILNNLEKGKIDLLIEPFLISEKD